MEANKLASTIISVSCRTLIFVLALLVLFFLGRTGFEFGSAVFNEKAMSSSKDAVEISVVIPDGASAKDIGKILSDSGLVENSRIFYFQARLSDYYGKFKAGTYTLSTDMTPTQMMAVLAPPDETTEE